MAYNFLSINYLSLINRSIFYGNFVVTVLSSVEHAVTEACDLKNNSCLQHDRSPHETIDRGALSSGLYTYGTLLSTKFLLMCLTLSCSEGLGCGEFILDCLIFLRSSM